MCSLEKFNEERSDYASAKFKALVCAFGGSECLTSDQSPIVLQFTS